MERLTVKFIGGRPLLVNNPRTVDPFDEYARAKKRITSKRSKTDEDLEKLRELEVESKLYFEDGRVVVPSTWISAGVAGCAWKLKKISKAEVRGGLFMREAYIPLTYDGMDRVTGLSCIAKDPKFIETLLLKQGQVKIAKSFPVFKDWSFVADMTYNPLVLDRETLVELLSYIAEYGGLGDFRPTYGRGTMEILP